VAIPLTCTRDAEITLLANLISLTPGTLSLDVSADRRLLFVHVMDIEGGADAVRYAITNDLERRVLAVLHDPKG
jgi:multicomponent Na+:H+ antiporter subunit E